MKRKESLGPSYVYLQLIAAIEEVAIDVMVELCLNVLVVLGISTELTLNVMVMIFLKGRVTS